MIVTYSFPVSKELTSILPAKIARVSATRVGFQLAPIRGTTKAVVEWTQKDNVRGLQQWRGYGGSPTRIQPIGSNRYRVEPGVYGEFFEWDEQTLAMKAGDAQGNVVINLTEEVTEMQDTMILRELDRIEQIIWLVFTTGTYAISEPRGDGLNVVVYTDTFAIQTATVAVPWATSATATPLKNFRDNSLLGVGKGVSFGAGAVAYMNRVTYNAMIGNTNANDLGGKTINGGDKPDSLDEFNKILVAKDLPSIVIYDEGYYNDANDFTRFIPTNKVVIVGKRPGGDKIAEYIKTRNIYANNQGASYDLIIDYTKGNNGPLQIGKGIELHHGHNGAMAVYYPGSILVMDVS